MNNLLSAHALSIEIGGKTVCQQLDLQIQASECWAVLGMNGVGKTTLLHTLAGLRPPLAGSIKLLNQDLTQLSKRYIAQHLGLLLQDYEDAFPGTVIQTVLTGRHPHLNNWQWESVADIAIAHEALSFVGMETFAERSILTLSGGERRRVAIATLLCQQPKLLLLDEPTNHLDLRYQQQILSGLTELVRDKQHDAIMIMHDVNLAMRYCDHALLLFEDGSFLAGACGDVMNADNLTRLYDYPMRSLRQNNREIFIPG